MTRWYSREWPAVEGFDNFTPELAGQFVRDDPTRMGWRSYFVFAARRFTVFLTARRLVKVFDPGLRWGIIFFSESVPKLMCNERDA